MFRDVLQEVLKAEMDSHQTEEMDTQVRLESELGPLELIFLETEMVNLNLRLFLSSAWWIGAS